MKYRLKKDLPFAKAGAEVRFNKEKRQFEAYSEYWEGAPNGWYGFAPASELTLIDEGWIEEVKPREWWTVVDSKGNISNDGTKWTKEYAERIAERDNISPVMDLKPYKAIKVREVLDSK